VTVPALPATAALDARLAGSPLVLLLDIDGTLSPIAPRPEHAVVSADTQRVLTALVAAREAHVVIVTGRAAEDARRLVGVSGVWVIGNHGMELARPDQPSGPRADAGRYAESIAAAVARVRAIAEHHEGVVIEDKRWTLSVHYRLADPRVVPELTHDVARIAEECGLRMTHGKEVLELRPPIGVDKGTAAVEVVQRLGGLNPGASVLCAGDDQTDEDAFRALRAAQPVCVTVRVGAAFDGATTRAEFSVVDTDGMRALLEHVLELRGAAVTRG
jgi:trehalose-phosphatase